MSGADDRSFHGRSAQEGASQEGRAPDRRFQDRADALIALAGRQLEAEGAPAARASTLYGAARFCAFAMAAEQRSAAEVAARREEIVETLSADFRRLLEADLDRCIDHFEEWFPHR